MRPAITFYTRHFDVLLDVYLGHRISDQEFAALFEYFWNMQVLDRPPVVADLLNETKQTLDAGRIPSLPEIEALRNRLRSTTD
jgi:hypothetical protein